MSKQWILKSDQPEGRAHILFVDDNQQLALVEKRLLEHFGYNVTISNSGMEALKMFRDQPDQVDLVITDVVMPKMSGLELAGELRRMRSDLPIIFCSGNHEGLPEEVLARLGVRSWLRKPIPARELNQAVQQALEENPPVG